jgi:hypothetical protein
MRASAFRALLVGGVVAVVSSSQLSSAESVLQSQYQCQNGSLVDTKTGKALTSARRCGLGIEEVELTKGTCAAGKLLDSIGRGHTTRSDIELVIAHHDEDLSWSDPFSSIRTVYTKGKAEGTVSPPARCRP